MADTLEVVDLLLPKGAACHVAIDRYVPLRFLAFTPRARPAYVRLGNYRTRLFDILLDPSSGAACGVTLCFFDMFSMWPKMDEQKAAQGLPVFDAKLGPAERIDTTHDFEVAMKGDEMLVSWGTLEGTSRVEFRERLVFHVRERVLRGVSLQGLTNDEIEILRSSATSSVELRR